MLGKSEISKLHKKLEDEARQKEKLQGDIAILQSQLLQLSIEADEVSYLKCQRFTNAVVDHFFPPVN